MVKGTSEIQTGPQRTNKPLRWTMLLIDMTKVISFCCQNFQPILWGFSVGNILVSIQPKSFGVIGNLLYAGNVKNQCCWTPSIL